MDTRASVLRARGSFGSITSDIWTETSLPLNEPYLFRDNFFFIDKIIITNARTHARKQASPCVSRIPELIGGDKRGELCLSLNVLRTRDFPPVNVIVLTVARIFGHLYYTPYNWKRRLFPLLKKTFQKFKYFQISRMHICISILELKILIVIAYEIYIFSS